MRIETRFLLAYCIVAAGLASMLTLLCLTAAAPAARKVSRSGLTPITNASPPNEIEKHFAGDPVQVFDPRELGLPGDGYCRDYSNQVSWRVLVCMGTQPETQP